MEVICAGREVCTGDYRIDRTTFAYWAVEFVAAGEGELSLAGKTVPLQPGIMFAYGPGLPQCIATDPQSPLVKYFVDFVGRPAEALLHRCRLGPGSARSVAAIGDIRDAFEQVLKLAAGPIGDAERICALQLEILLHLAGQARGSTSAVEARSRANYERIRAFVDARFLEVSTVEDIATACHVDRSHLSRLFRRFGGEPPLKYLQRRKMQWAAERLKSPGSLVRQVADELDTDPFNFSRSFKRIYGVAPSEFQKAVS